MKLKKLLLAAALVAPFGVAQAEDDNDFGLWTEVSAEKHLTHTLDLGLEGEVRTADNFSQIDRLSGGLKLSYKPIKYVKFAVAGVFYGEYQPEKMSKEVYDVIYNDEGDPMRGPLMEYRFTESNWKPNLRFYFEATGTRKFFKWLRISLRERYQFNYEFESTRKRTGFERDDEDSPWEPSNDGVKTNDAESRHRLRSRLKLEYDRKGCAWSPFVSVELHNKLDYKMHTNKVRTSIGTGYKINRHHQVGLAYLYSRALDVNTNPTNTPNKHAINVSYGFDF